MPERFVENTRELRWTAPGLFRSVFESMGRALSRIHVRRKPRALHLEETLALGDKRFLAVVEWKDEKLLLGVTSHTISLLDTRGEQQARKFAWEKERIA
jgi:flagellar biogenesis protein FliO